MTELWLGSRDSTDLNGNPRSCTVIGRVAHKSGRVILDLALDPPLEGEDYGFSPRKIGRVVVSPKYDHIDLDPVSEWPAYVFVLEPASFDPGFLAQITRSDYEILAWGELYQSKEAALEFKFPE